MKVKEYKEYVEGETIELTPDKNVSAMFRHAFTQINNHAEIVNKYEVSEKKSEMRPQKLLQWTKINACFNAME